MSEEKTKSEDLKNAALVASGMLIAGVVGACLGSMLVKNDAMKIAHWELHNTLAAAYSKGEDIVDWVAADGKTYKFLVKFLEEFETVK